MPFPRICWILSGFLLVANVAIATGQVVYKWKDSAGSVHFTDTPPPSEATLLKGPKPAPVPEPNEESIARRGDKPLLSAPCRTDISAADCEAARRALQADLASIDHDRQQAPGNTTRAVSDGKTSQPIAARANDCSMWRDVLASLEDRKNDANPERLTASARSALPGQIADAERRIAASCE